MKRTLLGTRMTTRLGAVTLIVALSMAPSARAGVTTTTGRIQNSAGFSRNCVCSVACVSARGCPEIGLGAQGSRVSARTVGPGVLCFCDEAVSPKKIRLEACLEDFVDGVPLVCSPGR